MLEYFLGYMSRIRIGRATSGGLRRPWKVKRQYSKAVLGQKLLGLWRWMNRNVYNTGGLFHSFSCLSPAPCSSFPLLNIDIYVSAVKSENLFTYPVNLS